MGACKGACAMCMREVMCGQRVPLVRRGRALQGGVGGLPPVRVASRSPPVGGLPPLMWSSRRPAACATAAKSSASEIVAAMPPSLDDAKNRLHGVS